MHDPMTVAFEIKYPWKNKRLSAEKFWKERGGYRDSFITIWHVDPEKDGSDDSCDWFNHRLNKREKAWMDNLIDNEVDNILHLFPGKDDYEARHILYIAMKRARDYYKPRHWWQKPKWHIWHWELQVHPWQTLRRWLFTRCAGCGKRFAWGESPCSFQWDRNRPRFLRGEEGVYHMRCADVHIASWQKVSG